MGILWNYGMWSHKGSLLFISTWVRSWLKEQVFCNGPCWIAGEYSKFLVASEEDFDKNWSWYCRNHLIWSNLIFHSLDIFKQFITLTGQYK